MLAGCAGGRLGPMPVLKSPGAASEVTVVRSNSLLGAPATMLVTVDGQRVWGLRLGQSFSLRLDPGLHNLGYDLGFNRCRERIEVESGQRYWIRLTPVCRIDVRRY
jgi:hypothetical protein